MNYGLLSVCYVIMFFQNVCYVGLLSMVCNVFHRLIYLKDDSNRQNIPNQYYGRQYIKKLKS